MPQILNCTRIIKNKRQLPSLKNILTKSEFTDISAKASAKKNCNEARCRLCKHIIQGDVLK